MSAIATATITLQEFAQAKRDMERNLAVLIQGELSKFEMVTGLMCRRVHVNMVSVRKVSDAHDPHMVSSVEVETPIG